MEEISGIGEDRVITKQVHIHRRIRIRIQIPVQARWRPRFTQVAVLRDEPAGVRVVVSRPEVDEPGILVFLFAGEHMPIDAVTNLVEDHPPWVEEVAGLDVPLAIGEVYRAPKSV